MTLTVRSGVLWEPGQRAAEVPNKLSAVSPLFLTAVHHFSNRSPVVLQVFYPRLQPPSLCPSQI